MDAFEKLKSLKEMQESGMISAEEFEQLKKPLLEQMAAGNMAAAPGPAPAPATRSVNISVSSPNNGQPGFMGVSEEPATTGMKVLSFLLPLIGLILYLVDRDKKPIAAKEELKWAGIGFAVGVVFYILRVAIVASMYY